MKVTRARGWLCGLVVLTVAPGPIAATAQDVSTAAPASIPARLEAGALIASDNHPLVRSRRSASRAAATDVTAARWLRYPSVTVEGMAYPPQDDRADDNGYRGSVSVELPVWTSGRISGTIRRAEAAQLVSEAQVQEAVRDTLLRLVQVYFEVARNARRAAILQASLDEHRLLVGSISRRVAQEISPAADLDLAASRAAQIEQELALASAQRSIAVQQVREIVGDPAFELGAAPAYDPLLHHPSPDGAIEQALTCDPVRLRLQAQALVAQADVKVAKAQRLPQLNAQYLHDEALGDDRVGLVLRAQTGAGLSQYAAARSAQQRQEASELEIAVAESQLRDAVALDLVENISAQGRIGAGRDAARSARSVTESYKRQFVAGRRTWLDVMNAVREATTAELAQTDTEISAMASASRLLLRTCRWTPELGDPQ